MPNFYSSPVLISVGGKYEDVDGTGGAKSSTVELLYIDPSVGPNSYLLKTMHSMAEATHHPFVGQLGDDLIVAAPESKKIFAWNHTSERFNDTGYELTKKREFGMSVKTSSRWFPDCRGEDSFEKTFSSCLEAMKVGGVFANKGQTITLKMTDGSYKDCSLEDIYETGSGCPKNWYGKVGDELCFKVHTDPVDNEEAAR